MSEDETSKIDLLVRRNYGIGLNELYGKLRHDYGFSRNPSTLYRYLKKTGYFLDLSKNRKRYVPKKYDTPEKIGEKWQLDVKYVPRSCKASSLAFDHKFYQYTVIDEATRERFIYFYEEQDSLNSIDFMKRAITYFRYRPKIVQTDNGHEFTFSSIVKKKITHPFNEFLTGQGIIQQVIRPRTPRHNGKVERSHRNDNERFYKTLKFYSYQDLLDQGKKYLKRSNNIPTIVLNWMTPLEKRRELLLLQHGVVEN
jgi:transposase InsO family protein